MHADMDAAAGQAEPSVGLEVDSQSGEGDDGFNGIDSPQAMGGASKTDPLNRDVKQWMPEDIDTPEDVSAFEKCTGWKLIVPVLN